MPKTDSIRHDEVWSLNRDALFAERLGNDIKRLMDAGVPDDYIKKLIGQFDYARVWAQTPKFLFPAKTLPRGYRWTDGMKSTQGAFKGKSGARTVIFLLAENDLYVKGYQLIGTNPKECKCVYIKDYEKYTAREVYIEFMHDRMMQDMILKFWKEHGLRIGWVEYTTPQEARNVEELLKQVGRRKENGNDFARCGLGTN